MNSPHNRIVMIALLCVSVLSLGWTLWTEIHISRRELVAREQYRAELMAKIDAINTRLDKAERGASEEARRRLDVLERAAGVTTTTQPSYLCDVEIEIDYTSPFRCVVNNGEYQRRKDYPIYSRGI